MEERDNETYQCGMCGRPVSFDENVNNGYCPECTEEYDK